MKYTYLLVDIMTILVPFLFSFHPKLRFDRTWKAFFPAVLLTALPFLIWDMYFTAQSYWGFNPRYLTGIEIGNLPVEEVLFFFCIPYACVFTYYCLTRVLWKTRKFPETKFFTLVLAGFLLFLAFLYFEKSYTATTFISLSVLLLLAHFILRVGWINRFYAVYAILLLPFFIVNGILTGTGIEEEVVWYNPEEFMGFRFGTIPVEDIFYGALLLLINLLIYEYILSKFFVSQENSGKSLAT